MCHTAHLQIWGLFTTGFTFVFRLKFKGLYPRSAQAYCHETYSVSRHLRLLLETSFVLGVHPRIWPPGRAKFSHRPHCAPSGGHIYARRTMAMHGFCSRKDPSKNFVYLGPLPPTNFVQGVSNMVHFDDSCVFRGKGSPDRGSVHIVLQTGHWSIAVGKMVGVVLQISELSRLKDGQLYV